MAFNFSIFKAPLKARHCGGQIYSKIPTKSPGSPEADNNVEQQLGVVLIKLKHERRASIYAPVICIHDHCGVYVCGKIPAKSPGSPEADNNMEQQLVVVLMKTYLREVLNLQAHLFMKKGQ